MRALVRCVHDASKTGAAIRDQRSGAEDRASVGAIGQIITLLKACEKPLSIASS